MSKQPKVLIVTGPCGLGKTTIANLIVKNNGFMWDKLFLMYDYFH